MKWLERYVDSENFQPCHAVLSHDGYAVVTDARSVLAVRGAFGEPLDSLKSRGQGNLLRDLLGAPAPPDATRTTLGDLWDWFDVAHRTVCPECRAGDLSEYCQECNGRGWLFREPRGYEVFKVRVAGQILDVNRLVWWLPAELGEPPDPVSVWPTSVPTIRKKTSAKAVIFAGPSWRSVNMGMDDGPGLLAGLKSYRTYVPGAGLWYTTRRQSPPEVHPGTDWFIDNGFEPGDYVAMWGEAKGEGT